MDKPKTVVLAPGVLEEMEAEFSPEELQEILNEIKTIFEDDNFLEHGDLIDMDQLEKDDPVMFKILQQRISELEKEDLPSNPPKRVLH